jgi:hypothetical protein
MPPDQGGVQEHLKIISKFNRCIFLQELENERLMFYSLDFNSFCITNPSSMPIGASSYQNIGTQQIKLFGMDMHNFGNTVIPFNFDPNIRPFVFVNDTFKQSIHI